MKRFLLLPVIAVPALAQQAEFGEEDVRFFKEKVRPVLEANCFECHGGTGANGKVKIRSGLQLISRKGITNGGDHGPAFNPSEPEKSLLLHVISYEDEKLKMPERGKLPDEEIAILTDWVKRGLPWTPEDADFLHEVHENEDITTVNEKTKSFWSYRALRRPVVPQFRGPWGQHPVDAFLATALRENGLTPNGPATRRELIRRATYGLTGLPPTLAEVQAFENDKSPDAWEKVIDRLLASPHYGEKWARHWLDVVRYAESNGFERDADKPEIWRYRDWVIDALNRDKPYDQFLIEQLAGDEIAQPTTASKIATGYHLLMQWDDEPADRLQHMFDNLDDNVRITSEGMLAMTLGCARCHDHKGDPVSQEDYYSFMAFFRGVKSPGKGQTNIENLGGGDTSRAFREAVKKFEEAGRRNLEELAETERLLRSQLLAAYPALRGKLSEKDGGKLKPMLSDARSPQPTTWFYTTSKPSEDWSAVGFRAENADWKRGPAGFGTKGTPGLQARTVWNTPEIWLQATFLLEKIPTAVEFALLHDEDVELYLNGQLFLQRKGYRTDYEKIRADRKFLNALQTGRNVIAAHVRQTSGGQSFDFGINAVLKETYTLDEALAQAKKGVDRSLVAKRKDLKTRIASHERKRPKPGGLKAQVVQEHGKVPPALHVHIRGNANAKSETVVTTRIPEIWGGEELSGNPPAHGRNTSGRRLALAKWMTKPDNPRTSRVMMNRIWQHHFGRGICPTPNDFGFLGERPSHPELLDWLATEFVKQGWSMKKMHKLIMMSRAYQMSSRGQAAALEKDPANKFWWRFDMRRLTAEEVRDSILAATGELNLKLGGPSVFIKLPEEVLATSSTKGAKWGTSPPEEQVRRSVYMKVKRSLIPPIMADFDLADTDNTCPVRFTSVLPTQALALLNSEFANEEAERFAKRLREEAGGDAKRQVALAFELAFSRPATQREIDYGAEFIEVMMREHRLTQKEAFDRFALLVLNLNEFLFID